MASAFMTIFGTTTSRTAPLDASRGTEDKPAVSDFLTVQSFANFAAMTGAITAAWHALQVLNKGCSTLWVPYLFAFFWAAISVFVSLAGLKAQEGPSKGKVSAAVVLQAVFLAALNALVLAGAVVGTATATSAVP